MQDHYRLQKWPSHPGVEISIERSVERLFAGDPIVSYKRQYWAFLLTIV